MIGVGRGGEGKKGKGRVMDRLIVFVGMNKKASIFNKNVLEETGRRWNNETRETTYSFAWNNQAYKSQ